MTDSTDGAPAPPKKRSFFKKAAWQTASKAEEEDKNMFSHSNEFSHIVAEQTRQREEEKRKAEEAKRFEEARKAEEVRKRKAEERQAGKRRRISTEDDEFEPPGLGSPSSPSQARRSEKKSRTPLSPTLHESRTDASPSLFETHTKSPIRSRIENKESLVIDLGDSDDEDISYNTQARLSRRPPSEEVEETKDPMLAALEAEALQRAARRAQSASIQSKANAARAPAIAQLLLTSVIPDTSPLMVKVRIESTMEKPRLAWCEKQGFSPEMTKSVFITFKGQKIYDSTMIRRLGLRIDDDGTVYIDGDPNIYDEANPPKVHVEAWTEELFRAWKKKEAEEAEAKRKAKESTLVLEQKDPTPEPMPEVKKIRLFLKAKGKEEFRLSVHLHTTIEHLMEAYKQKMGVDQDQPITLMFDGDRLSPMDTVADADIDDMDSIEVHFK